MSAVAFRQVSRNVFQLHVCNVVSFATLGPILNLHFKYTMENDLNYLHVSVFSECAEFVCVFSEYTTENDLK